MAGTGGGVRSGSGSVMYGQLLLLAALLFGIVTMHTVGHPAEHADRGAAAPPAAVAMPALPVAGAAPPMPVAVSDTAHPMPVAVSGAAHPMPVPVPVVEAATAPAAGASSDAGHPSHHSPDDAPMSGMDPLSVCLAVLGVWGLVVLTARLFGLRADGRTGGTPIGAGLLRVPRPNPPPPISVLAGISVLRI
ncbi:hypothetical protein [Streptomyces sp. cmx-18-6]|uniref:hypothetical protein n=1 Tax=Streptomyces sp. cmx-18-6 TaxID=2790930 RepID=UPI0039813E1D